MGIFLIILCVIFFLIMFILFADIRIFFTFKSRERGGFDTSARVCIYSKVVGFNIPAAKSHETVKKPIEEAEKAELFGEENYIKKVIDNIETIVKIKQAHFDSWHFVKGRINIEELNAHIEFGTGDAAKTGITTGIVYGTLYNFMGILTKYIRVYKHDFRIKPNYEKEVLNISTDGIITFKIVNITFILFMYIKNYLKADKRRKPANTPAG